MKKVIRAFRIVIKTLAFLIKMEGISMETIITERKNGTRRVRHVIEGDSMTEQQHKKRCNINTIMAKAKKGHMPEVVKGGTFGDFTSAVDYQTALDRIHNAHVDFEQLPSEVRKRFGNDPADLIDFLADPANLEEAVEMGLVEMSLVEQRSSKQLRETPMMAHEELQAQGDPEASQKPSGE